jgi:hypothetical protein
MSEEGNGPEITIDTRRFAGVWANAVRVDGSHPVEPRGIVVSRVTFSPPFQGTESLVCRPQTFHR